MHFWRSDEQSVDRYAIRKIFKATKFSDKGNLQREKKKEVSNIKNF